MGKLSKFFRLKCYLKIWWLVVFVLLSSCTDSDKEKDTIVIGTTIDNAPYSFLQNQQISGIDIDVIQEVAKKIGKKAVIKVLDFPSLINAVENKRVDVAIAGISITKDRLSRIHFSHPYSNSNCVILYKKNTPISDYKDLHQKKVGVEIGSSHTWFARDLSKKVAHRVISSPDMKTLIQNLNSNKIDAIISEERQAKIIHQKNPDIDYFLVKERCEDIGVVVHHQNLKLLQAINNALNDLIQAGVIEKIHHKWQ